MEHILHILSVLIFIAGLFFTGRVGIQFVMYMVISYQRKKVGSFDLFHLWIPCIIWGIFYLITLHLNN